MAEPSTSSAKTSISELLRLVLVPFRAFAALLNSIDTLIFSLLVAAFLTLLVGLPLYRAVQFLAASAPWWAYLVAAGWLAAFGRFLVHLVRNAVDWFDALVYGLTLFAAFLVLVLE